MSNFIVSDEGKEQDLQRKLEASPFKNSTVETFISLYNSGVISRTHPENAELAQLVVDSYSTVIKKRGKLRFIPKLELDAKAAIYNLAPWSIYLRVQREVKEAIAEGNMLPTDFITVHDRGTLMRITPSLDEHGNVNLSDSGEHIYDMLPFDSDKVRGPAVKFLDELADERKFIPVQSILDLDGSFIEDIIVVIPPRATSDDEEEDEE